MTTTTTARRVRCAMCRASHLADGPRIGLAPVVTVDGARCELAPVHPFGNQWSFLHADGARRHVVVFGVHTVEALTCGVRYELAGPHPGQYARPGHTPGSTRGRATRGGCSPAPAWVSRGTPNTRQPAPGGRGFAPHTGSPTAPPKTSLPGWPANATRPAGGSTPRRPTRTATTREPAGTWRRMPASWQRPVRPRRCSTSSAAFWPPAPDPFAKRSQPVHHGIVTGPRSADGQLPERCGGTDRERSGSGRGRGAAKQRSGTLVPLA